MGGIVPVNNLEIDFNENINQKHLEEGIEKGVRLLYRSNSRVYGYYKLACGHESFLHYGAVRKTKTGDFKCAVCMEEKLREQASARNVKFVKRIDTVSSEYVHNICGHSFRALNNSMTLSAEDFTCPTCEQERFINRILELSLTKISHEEDSKGRSLYLLSCGHTKWISRSSIREGSFRCRVCQEGVYEQEALKHNLIYHRGEKASHYDYRLYTLPCGCIKELSPARVKEGAWECKTHRTTRTVSLNREMYVYLIKIRLPIGDVLKIGYTSDVVGRNKRYSRYGVPMSNVEPIIELVFTDGNKAVLFEKYIHTVLLSKNIEKDLLKPYMAKGYTECYPLELQNELFSLFANNKAADHIYFCN